MQARRRSIRDHPRRAASPFSRVGVQSLPAPSSGAAVTFSVSLSLFKSRSGGTCEDADKRASQSASGDAEREGGVAMDKPTVLLDTPPILAPAPESPYFQDVE